MPRAPWTPEEKLILEKLDSPDAIQWYLDSIPYSADESYRCPRSVMRDRKAHCFDGACFAAAALKKIGIEPLLVNMRAVRDDEHVVAIFKRKGRLGAVAKSKFAGLRFREPLYRDLRELMMSYFEHYYNTESEKTLRSYSAPLKMNGFDKYNWLTEDSALEKIAERLDALKHLTLISKADERILSPVDERSYKAGLLGVNEAGLYRPGGK